MVSNFAMYFALLAGTTHLTRAMVYQRYIISHVAQKCGTVRQIILDYFIVTEYFFAKTSLKA